MNELGQTQIIFFVIGALVIVLMVAILVGQILWWRYIDEYNAEIRNSVLSRKFISLNYFESNWIADRPYGQRGTGSVGYKYNDMTGCYVILVFNEKPNEQFSNYENSYVGQSVNVCQRVHNHFNGKGNGDVYADRKYGKHLYVQFFPCSKENMNDVEKMLIAAFDSASSYNKTRGGSRRYQ